ncbi:hypothetical protein BGZ80_008213, partial [Entomortierella chlamydospora]
MGDQVLARYRNYSRHPRSLREQGIMAATELVLQEIAMPQSKSNIYSISYTLVLALATYNYFKTVRYLNPRPAESVFKSPVYRDQVLSQLSPIAFRKAMRVTPRQFNFIVEVIQGHPVFLSRGRKPQAEVATQLKVALHRLAHNGSHASYESLARIF